MALKVLFQINKTVGGGVRLIYLECQNIEKRKAIEIYNWWHMIK